MGKSNGNGNGKSNGNGHAVITAAPWQASRLSPHSEDILPYLSAVQRVGFSKSLEGFAAIYAILRRLRDHFRAALEDGPPLSKLYVDRAAEYFAEDIQELKRLYASVGIAPLPIRRTEEGRLSIRGILTRDVAVVRRHLDREVYFAEYLPECWQVSDAHGTRVFVTCSPCINRHFGNATAGLLTIESETGLRLRAGECPCCFTRLHRRWQSENPSAKPTDFAEHIGRNIAVRLEDVEKADTGTQELVRRKDVSGMLRERLKAAGLDDIQPDHAYKLVNEPFKGPNFKLIPRAEVETLLQSIVEKRKKKQEVRKSTEDEYFDI